MIFKAVLFDLGGTLIKTAPPPEIIRRILTKYGVERSIKDIALAHEGAERSMSTEDYRLAYYDFWIKWNRRILEALEIHENTDLLARVLVDEWWDNAGLEPYDDAEEALLGLRGLGLKIGIVTNAFIKDIEEILARVSLPRVFDILVGIDSVGRAKPDPEVFRYAIKLLRIQPNEAVFIGDSLERDYFGALNAGLRAILIDRENSVRGNIVKISNLREIPKILDLQK